MVSQFDVLGLFDARDGSLFVSVMRERLPNDALQATSTGVGVEPERWIMGPLRHAGCSEHPAHRRVLVAVGNVDRRVAVPELGR